MEIRVTIIWHIVIDDNIDSLDINSTAEYISGYHDTVFEILESLVMLDTESH